MTSAVYFGSPRQAHLDANESLPAKLDLILESLHLREWIAAFYSGANVVLAESS